MPRYEDVLHPEDIVTRYVKNTVKGSVGCPIGVQLSCLPFEDEKLCGASLQVEKAVNYDKLPISTHEQYKPKTK